MSSPEPRPALATYVDSPYWVQQHIGADAQFTWCEMPIGPHAVWTPNRSHKKPLCPPCSAIADVYAVVSPAKPQQLDLFERRPRPPHGSPAPAHRSGGPRS